MPIVRSYLRFSPSGNPLGVVCSGRGNIAHVPTRNGLAVPALQNVIVWNPRTATEMCVLKSGSDDEVTCIATGDTNDRLAVGYADGRVLLFNLAGPGSLVVTFAGHSSAITTLQYDSTGTQLASGSADGDIVVWDVIGEAGIYRLKGHKGAITGLQFAPKHSLLLSSSRDTYVKVWDVDTRHCLQTIVGHRCEVTSLVALDADAERFVTGSADIELRIFKLVDTAGEADATSKVRYDQIGSIARQSRDRCVMMKLHRSGRFLAVQAADKSIEIVAVRSEAEAKKKLQRRQKRMREKKRAKGETGEVAVATGDEEAEEEQLGIDDYFARVHIVRLQHKGRSFDFSDGVVGSGVAGAGEGDDGVLAMSLSVATHANTVELYRVSVARKDASSDTAVGLLDSAGHRSDVRCVAFSYDGHLLCTGGSDGIKVWNSRSHACIRTISGEYVLSLGFVPGNRHVVCGTKDGRLLIFDIAAAELVSSVPDAHKGSIWSLQVSPDGNGLMTGSSDKCVHFWDFELKGGKTLHAVHVRTLQMEDDVMVVRYDPKQRVIALALLDATVKVFHADTLKFALSLYGHKLPVLAMDVSSDGTLLVTASADKNVKIWGLDFGDCHRSMFAHQDAVTSVRFVPETHFFFTGGKDARVRYWDGDRFAAITTMPGHMSDVWAIDVSRDGRMLVSASRDRSVRLWQRSQDQIFLEEERERERDEEAERQMLEQDRGSGRTERVGAGVVDETTGEPMDNSGDTATGGGGDEAALAIRNRETVRDAERVVEALELCDDERARLQQHAESAETLAFQPNPILVALGGMTPDRYVLHTMEKVRPADLDEVLLSLPFTSACSLLRHTLQWLRQERSLATELACRIVFFLVRTHHPQLVSTKSMLDTLDELRVVARARAAELRDTAGFNLAALRALRARLESRGTTFFTEQLNAEQAKRSRKRKMAFGSV